MGDLLSNGGEFSPEPTLDTFEALIDAGMEVHGQDGRVAEFDLDTNDIDVLVVMHYLIGAGLLPPDYDLGKLESENKSVPLKEDYKQLLVDLHMPRYPSFVTVSMDRRQQYICSIAVSYRRPLIGDDCLVYRQELELCRSEQGDVWSTLGFGCVRLNQATGEYEDLVNKQFRTEDAGPIIEDQFRRALALALALGPLAQSDIIGNDGEFPDDNDD